MACFLTGLDPARIEGQWQVEQVGEEDDFCLVQIVGVLRKQKEPHEDIRLNDYVFLRHRHLDRSFLEDTDYPLHVVVCIIEREQMRKAMSLTPSAIDRSDLLTGGLGIGVLERQQ